MKCTVNGTKLKSHNTSYCLIEVVTKAGLTVVKYINHLSSIVADNVISLSESSLLLVLLKTENSLLPNTKS